MRLTQPSITRARTIRILLPWGSVRRSLRSSRGAQRPKRKRARRRPPPERRTDGRTSVARKARERGKTGFAHSVRQRREGRRDDGAVSGVSNLVKVRASKVFDSDLIIALKPTDNVTDYLAVLCFAPDVSHHLPSWLLAPDFVVINLSCPGSPD